MSNESDKSTLASSEQNTCCKDRYPFTEDHIFVITELAKLGMAYLSLVLPQFEKELEGAGKNKITHYEHLKSLYEVAGEETIKHFDEMCQYIWTNRKAADNDDANDLH